MRRISSRRANLNIIQRQSLLIRKFRQRCTCERRCHIRFCQQSKIGSRVSLTIESGEEGLQDDFTFSVGDLRGLDAERAGGAEGVGKGEVCAGSGGESVGGG